MHAHEDIRIGTLVPVHERTAKVIRQLLPLGFETFQLSFGHRVGEIDLRRLAGDIGEVLSSGEAADGVPRRISALGLYGNPLTSPEVVADWERLIDAARNRLKRGFRDNTWLLVTKGTDYELAPPAAKRVRVVRTIYAEADGEPLPDPDPANIEKQEFAWMTVHKYTPDKPVTYPFKDLRSLEPFAR